MKIPQPVKAAVIAMALLGQLGFALAASAPPQEPDESELATHNHYVNKSGLEVHSPSADVAGKIPSGSSAKCRDGTYSFSKHHSGTCSRHGGVAAWE